MKISGLDHVAIGVRSISQSVKWYSSVLLLEKITYPEWGDKPIIMQGENGSGIALFEAIGNIKDNSGNLPHIAFKIDGLSYSKFKSHFADKSIRFYEEDYQICKSIFIRDPDNYLIELAWYY